MPDLLKEAGVTEAPPARVGVFVGNAWDPADGRETPWIDLARQLAGEPGVAALGPAALTTPPGTHAAAVISLPRSQVEMTDWDHQWQERITKVVRRVARDLIAIDESEISEVVHRVQGQGISQGPIRGHISIPSCHPVGLSTQVARPPPVPADPRSPGHAGPVDLLGRPRAVQQGPHGAADHTGIGPFGRAGLPGRRPRPTGGDAPRRGHRSRDIHRRVGTTILFESSGGQVDKEAHLPATGRPPSRTPEPGPSPACGRVSSTAP